MSVRSEINRIKDAVTAIVEAIEGKGVTVPNGTKIDGLASLISSIPQAEATKTCTLMFDTNYAYNSVTVTYIKNGASTTTVIPEYSDIPIEVDCNTSITIYCASGVYFNYSPWGNNLSLKSPCTLTTPAESGVYDITFDNS